MEKPRKYLEELPIHEDTRKFIKEHNLSIRKNHMGKKIKPKYCKSDFLRIYEGYDALQNLILVRNYIQKKHDISLSALEVLLYLYPKQFFTHSDYNEVPKQYFFRTVKRMCDLGYIKIHIKGTGTRRNLYTLSNIGKRVVYEFYELLSGEKPIPETQFTDNAYEKKVINLIKKTKKLTKE